MNKFVTQRFFIRLLTVEDVSERYLYWLNSTVSEYISYRQTDMVSLRKYVADTVAQSNIFFYGIFCKDSQEHIGNVKFVLNQSEQRAEMGILIGEPVWHGVGVAKEVIQGFAEIASNEIGLKVITLGVEKRNVPALKAYLKMGFRPIREEELNDPEVAGIFMEMIL